jgi:hypothetical protein
MRELEDGGALPSGRYAGKMEEGMEQCQCEVRSAGFGIPRRCLSTIASGLDWGQWEVGPSPFCEQWGLGNHCPAFADAVYSG